VKSGLALGGQLNGVFRCKEVEKTWPAITAGDLLPDTASYGYNFLYLGLPYTSGVTVENPYDGSPEFQKGACRIERLENPAATVVLTESRYVWAFPSVNLALIRPGNESIRPRHNNKYSNVLWADGHVTSIKTNELVFNTWLFGKRVPGEDEGIAIIASNLWDRM
jgi:prepilin-type processing-associated H-X9-DG protein